jgi:catechol 2,3-dioxygenase-like lactoylglutathione lyase family enzyme
MAGLHHVEIWIADPDSLHHDWGWLLPRLGFERTAQWSGGVTWDGGGSYLTFTTSPRLVAAPHDRRRPGLNHLAFRAGDESDVDAIMQEAGSHGWTALYAERYPHAGGPEHYAGWLENGDGFKVEIVADRFGA